MATSAAVKRSRDVLLSTAPLSLFSSYTSSFAANLCSLQTSDKFQIQSLTLLAEQQYATQRAAEVVTAICQRMRQLPGGDERLPLFHLIDSICHNAVRSGHDYPTRFQQHLQPMFASCAKRCSPAARASLYRLWKVWCLKRLFHRQVLGELETILHGLLSVDERACALAKSSGAAAAAGSGVPISPTTPSAPSALASTTVPAPAPKSSITDILRILTATNIVEPDAKRVMLVDPRRRVTPASSSPRADETVVAAVVQSTCAFPAVITPSPSASLPLSLFPSSTPPSPSPQSAASSHALEALMAILYSPDVQKRPDVHSLVSAILNDLAQAQSRGDEGSILRAVHQAIHYLQAALAHAPPPPPPPQIHVPMMQMPMQSTQQQQQPPPFAWQSKHDPRRSTSLPPPSMAREASGGPWTSVPPHAAVVVSTATSLVVPDATLVCPAPTFSDNDLNTRRPAVVEALYQSLPFRCKTCGLRLADKAAMTTHLEWHFKMTRRAKIIAKSLHARSQGWYWEQSEWMNATDVVFGDETSNHHSSASLSATSCVGSTPSFPRMPQNVVADDSQPLCAHCGEPFKKIWCDEEEDLLFQGCVQITCAMQDPPRQLLEQLEQARLLNSAVLLSGLTETQAVAHARNEQDRQSQISRTAKLLAHLQLYQGRYLDERCYHDIVAPTPCASLIVNAK